MNLSEVLKDTSVLGAAGKMGSGIVLLTAQQMLEEKQAGGNQEGFELHAIDVSAEALDGLMRYVEKQAGRIAGKKTEKLEEWYGKLDQEELVTRYVTDLLNIIKPTTSLDEARNSKIILEAVSENLDLKIKLYTHIDNNNDIKPWFLTNTSSIPIGELNRVAGLNGRIIGFHFYNPPAVQKLVELIKGTDTLQELYDFSTEFASRMRKIVVPSNDKAGFIGNGHFMRDALHGLDEVKSLSDQVGFEQAVYIVNRISQHFLLRPMGIFQLIDYVGVDVCQAIMSVMDPYFPAEKIHHDLLDRMVEAEAIGGQNPDGSQKDGFLKYEEGRSVAVYNPDKQAYIPLGDFKAAGDEFIGATPEGWKPWKEWFKDPDKDSGLTAYFNALKKMNTHGGRLAETYLNRSREIGLRLVNENVANNEKDVNTVLLTGFFHLYGPINNYLK